MQITDKWTDFEIIDAGNGEKLERWKDVILRRPDPQAVWKIEELNDLWKKPSAFYHRSNSGGGYWEYIKKIPEYWTISYQNLTFKISPTNFKHTGLFPEQASNWDYMMNKIKKSNLKEIRVLNLFAYTGGATMACASVGASVVHVDSAKGMVAWAKENASLSNLDNANIRYIVDDAIKFVEREKRRGHTYHAIIMDPPSYGRGPNGEVWKLENNLFDLLIKCVEILDNDALFLLVNAYTTGFSAVVLENILKQTILKKYPHGKVEAGEIGLPITKNNLVLPCGIYGRWDSND